MLLIDTIPTLPLTPFPLYSTYVEEFVEFLLKLLVACSLVWVTAIQTLTRVRKLLRTEDAST